MIAFVLAVLAVLTSCRQELCYDHFPSLNVDLSWELEWERDYGEYHIDSWDADYFGKQYHDLKPPTPEWVNMVRYYDDGRYNENFLPPAGKKFQIDAGKSCSVLLYNGDTEYVVLSDVASLYNARAAATTRSRSLVSSVLERHPGSRTTNPPDVIYSAFIPNVDAVKNHEVRQMPVKMQPLVYTYMITFEFDYGIDNVVLARGALGGMAESVYLRTGATLDETSIILFDCTVNGRGCRAEVRSFGVPGFPDKYFGRTETGAPPNQYTLNLEVLLRNGKSVNFNFDITDQIKNQPRGGVIRIKGLEIEDVPEPTGGGFNVGVSDWDQNTQIIDLPIGRQTDSE